MTQQNPTKPVHTFGCANVTASVWRSNVKKDGRTVVRDTVKIRKMKIQSESAGVVWLDRTAAIRDQHQQRQDRGTTDFVNMGVREGD